MTKLATGFHSRSCPELAARATPLGKRVAHASCLAKMRCELARELRRAGHNAHDLIDAVGKFFEREHAAHGAPATTLLFALFVSPLRCTALDVAARADAPRCVSSEARAGCFPPARHGSLSADEVMTDAEALYWREAHRWGA